MHNNSSIEYNLDLEFKFGFKSNTEISFLCLIIGKKDYNKNFLFEEKSVLKFTKNF
jgi:hypothetical protein